MLDISFSPPILLIYYYRFIGVMSVFVNSFALYLIIFKGVKMDNFKYYLLNFQICCTYIDLHITFFMQPVGLFPLVAGYTNGLLAIHFNVSSHFLMCIADLFIAFQTSSLTLCFLRKHQAIANISKTQVISEIYKVMIVLALLVVSFVIAITFYVSGISKSQGLAYISQTYPEYYSNFVQLENFAVYRMSDPLFFSFCLIVVHGFICVSVIIYTTSQMFKMLQFNILRISALSYDKHRSALKSLVAQFITSSLCLVPPVILSAAIVLEYKQLQVLSHFLLAIFSTHSTANVIVMIATFPNYRKFVLFCRKQPMMITTSYSIALRLNTRFIK